MGSDTLDAFSRRFAQALFAAYPQWEPLAKIERADGGASSHLVVEVPSSPEADLSHGLYVLTENDEVTIGLDAYHCHFEWPPRDNTVIVDPVAFIGAVLDERVAVASVYGCEKWCGSWIVLDGQEPDDSKHRGHGRRLRLRSWKGSLNRDVTSY